MKRQFLVLIVLFFHLSAFAFQPPKYIKDSLTKFFPSADHVKWSQIKKESKGYVAAFKLGEKKYQVTIREDGRFVKAQSSINSKDLPEIVKKTLIIQNGGDVDLQIYDAKVIYIEPNEPEYEVTIRIDGHKTKLRITMQGGFTFL